MFEEREVGGEPSQFKRDGWKVLVRDLGRTDEAGAPPFTLF